MICSSLPSEFKIKPLRLKYLLYSILLFSGLLLSSCSKTYLSPTGTFSSNKTPSPPNYSDQKYWSALPTMSDMADNTPPGLTDNQSTAQVDVFFMYPTIYVGEKGDDQWNAPVDDASFNKRVDESTIKFQASIFNGAGKVYAPRYRQAHLNTYFEKDKAMAKKVFDLAYEDLKQAFEYYLENYNEGRPIIIAAHSQGTTHGIRLIKDYFDGRPLQEQLVAAYLVGIPVAKDQYQNIPICESAEQTGCFCSWRTFKEGHDPKSTVSPNIAVTNPLTWRTTEERASKELNTGGVLRNFNKVKKQLTSAQVVAAKGILWASKPKFFGSIFFRNKNYHIADYNFYYNNVRENAITRVRSFLEISK